MLSYIEFSRALGRSEALGTRMDNLAMRGRVMGGGGGGEEVFKDKVLKTKV